LSLRRDAAGVVVGTLGMLKDIGERRHLEERLRSGGTRGTRCRRGGRLTIETADAQLDEAYASRHLSVPPGAYVMLAVSGTEEGMGEQTRLRVFEPFCCSLRTRRRCATSPARSWKGAATPCCRPAHPPAAHRRDHAEAERARAGGAAAAAAPGHKVRVALDRPARPA
jgi:hypothetical protein